MTAEGLMTCTELGAELGLDPRTVARFAEALGVQPKRHPHNGLAKGLDRKDVKAIRKAVQAGKQELARSN
jgi:DNA-binding MurR/RpiR family transcriptional regulator